MSELLSSIPTTSSLASSVVMVRPHFFRTNPQTRADNAFQSTLSLTDTQISQRAFVEVSLAASALELHGIKVNLFEDTGKKTPDSVFPNNWFSSHPSGDWFYYPMLATNRRKERRKDVLRNLTRLHHVERIHDLTRFEQSSQILEGTGAMVFDHENHCFYVARSLRTDDALIREVEQTLGMKAFVFDTQDESGSPIYHTNVIMTLGQHFVAMCFDFLHDQEQKHQLIEQFKRTGKQIIYLSREQIRHFCGNMLELQGEHGSILALSTTAFNALNDIQKRTLSKWTYLQPLHVPTIESAGGSVRCMIGEVFLPKHS